MVEVDLMIGGVVRVLRKDSDGKDFLSAILGRVFTVMKAGEVESI